MTNSSIISTLNVTNIEGDYPRNTFRGPSLVHMILIGSASSVLFVFIVIGNTLVLLSFKNDKQLRTISNYFLVSLAVADLIIGLQSLPLFTVYMFLDYWPFDSTLCDAWLAIDYLVSNASILTLVAITFDRYFSITRPLTYRAKRTARRASWMIASAWGISVFLEPCWIYIWPYIEGERTLPDQECYIRFIGSNFYATFATSLVSFFIPGAIMLVLYWLIWQETKKRQRELSKLQAIIHDPPSESRVSGEDVDTTFRYFTGYCFRGGLFRGFLSIIHSFHQLLASQVETSVFYLFSWLQICMHCFIRVKEAFRNCCTIHMDEDDDGYFDEEDACFYWDAMVGDQISPFLSPSESTSSLLSANEYCVNPVMETSADSLVPSDQYQHVKTTPPLEREPLYMTNTMEKKYIKRKKNRERKQENRATKTLSAILLVFFVSWTPYNVLKIFQTSLRVDESVPIILLDIAYYLCYIHSALNPLCYAFCNATFRRNYVLILTCKWYRSKRLIY